MNILLVYPEVAETFWSFEHALRVVGRKAAFPPLSALTWVMNTIYSPEVYYRRLLTDGLSKYRQAFSDVVAMSIYGYRFRKRFWSHQLPVKWEDWWHLKGDPTAFAPSSR
jgi:hypothetical protein